MKNGRTITAFGLIPLFAFLLISCNSATENKSKSIDTLNQSHDTERTRIITGPQNKDSTAEYKETSFSNQRFKDVTVEKIVENKYTISGKAQIFEANFSWVVEDGHNEIKKGHEMTDAGAPAWGNFKFTIEVEKQRPNSILTLVLYEISAKDGSRQYELPIPLR